MSVPNFVKKKAQGSRLVAPKFDKETRQSIAKDLSKLGANVNQIAKLFKVSADDLNFSYSDSLTLKLICFGSLRLGFRFSPTDKSLAKLLSCSLIQSENRKPNRKEPKQISFRVSESEYEKLRSSAETLNMSVPNFVKKKAQGSRLVAPKFDKETKIRHTHIQSFGR